MHASTPPASGPSATGTARTTAGPAAAVSTSPARSHLCAGVAPCADFVTPTGNIKCFASALAGGGVECDIQSGLVPPPTAPCELDRPGLYVGATGDARSACRSDPTPVWFDAHAPALAYGSTWAAFGITCVSQESGLTCLNTHGSGFFLSRERWSLF